MNIIDYSMNFEAEYDFGNVAPIISYLKLLQNAFVILYGAGDIGYQKLFWLRIRGIKPLCIVDKKRIMKIMIFSAVH